MKINGREYRDHSAKITGVDGGIPGIALEKKRTTLVDKLAEGVNTVRRTATQKDVGIGRLFDSTA